MALDCFLSCLYVSVSACLLMQRLNRGVGVGLGGLGLGLRGLAATCLRLAALLAVLAGHPVGTLLKAPERRFTWQS